MREGLRGGAEGEREEERVCGRDGVYLGRCERSFRIRIKTTAVRVYK
jgi:hypothetical protein